MEERENVRAEQEGQKELTVEDLETVAGGNEVDSVDGVEIEETEGGNKGVRIS